MRKNVVSPYMYNGSIWASVKSTTSSTSLSWFRVLVYVVTIA